MAKKNTTKKSAVKFPCVVVGTEDFNLDTAPKYMVVELTPDFIDAIKKLRKVVIDNDLLIAETTNVPKIKYTDDTVWLKIAEQKQLEDIGGVVCDCDFKNFHKITEEELEFESESTTVKVCNDKFMIIENCDDGELFANITFDLIKDLLGSVEQNAEYCPKCNSGDVYWESVNTDGDSASQEGRCEECGCHWNTVFKFTHNEIISE